MIRGMRERQRNARPCGAGTGEPTEPGGVEGGSGALKGRASPGRAVRGLPASKPERSLGSGFSGPGLLQSGQEAGREEDASEC